MTKARKWAEEIKAWADGAEIQWYDPFGSRWGDFDADEDEGPWDVPEIEWRVKPELKNGWVRAAEHKDNTGAPWPAIWADFENKSEADIETRPDFIRWLSPRFDFDYPEDYEGGK